MPSARRGPCELEREERHRSILPPRERSAPDSLVRGSPGKQNQEEIDIQWRRPTESRDLDLSFLKETNPEYPLEGLMLKLKLQSLAT